MNNALTTLAIYAIPIFLSLTLPIALQAWMANRLGDPTPRMQGRLSWDPVKHMDVIGTVVLPGVFLLISGGLGTGILIGWGKQLELDVRRYRSKFALFLVESPMLIGPLLMALLWVLLAKACKLAGIEEEFVYRVTSAGFGVGLAFFAIAMLPFPPMPLGNAILRNLPAKYLFKILPILQYAPFIILGLLILGVLTPYIRFMMNIGQAIVLGLTFWL